MVQVLKIMEILTRNLKINALVDEIEPFSIKIGTFDLIEFVLIQCSPLFGINKIYNCKIFTTIQIVKRLGRQSLRDFLKP